jgi:hypothetical protein
MKGVILPVLEKKKEAGVFIDDEMPNAKSAPIVSVDNKKIPKEKK